VEPWYLSYALLGASVAGLAPILLPLEVGRTGTASCVGMTMAAVNLGGLTSPLWGALTDRYRLHRWLLAGGLGLTALGLAAFPFASTPRAWIGLALLQGLGAAQAATVANLFVVEAHPSSEWDERIGWLQAFYGGGQVAGLLLAVLWSDAAVGSGLLVGAALTAVAVLPGWLTARTPPGPVRPAPVLPHPARHGEWAVGSPQRHFHRGALVPPSRVWKSVKSPFGAFLAAWALGFAGAAAYFALYPVLMDRVYRVDPAYSTLGYAFAAGVGLFFYPLAGRWSDRLGAATVERIGLGIRLLVFLGLSGLALVRVPGRGVLAVLGFVVVVLAWSLLSVSGTALAARRSPVGKGEGLGIFNAVTALAGVVGAILGGWAAEAWGYGAVSGVAAFGVGVGVLAALLERQKNARDGG
jgi:MFS transporter, DHA1 family, tetracycline resistance protein